ncbi:MAG: hypothetical protein Q3M24_15830 [Candidatus Electrothrix aestuarii]|uniref:Tetratricopeptide repeat-containing protein n=1 Tax=Candidatus Electrothrix aestuarii TaxID=3062594 RepID=A0AAU8LSA0_9BACT|nr:hypothetical protein [Candidatus Electrothrix aestuarii]
MGSKENTILLFPSLALIEGIFFLQFAKIQNFAQAKKKLFLLLFFSISCGILFLSWDFIIKQANSYGHRNFTFLERVLTEPRILLFYLSQIFSPTTSKLSIVHDITLSTSFFSPWQTLPAITVCIGLIFLGTINIHKNPLLSFAILYYFLNHLVESTIIPLELIFEHRNLLPSLFLFLPFAAFVEKVISTKKWTALIAGIICIFFLFQSGYATIERNKAWKNTGTLNEDALIKAPRSARVKLNLASWYTGQKKFQDAFILCEKAEQYEANDASRNTIIPIARMQKGIITYELGQPEKALEYFQQAYAFRKDYTAAAEKLIAVLVELKRYNEALQIINERYTLTKTPSLLLLKGSVFLRQGKPTDALTTYRQAEPFYLNSALIPAGIGKALTRQGDYSNASFQLNKAVQQNNSTAMLLQVENSLLAGDNQKAEAQLNKLLRRVSLINLWGFLNTTNKDPFQIPLDKDLLRPALLKTTSQMLTDLIEKRNE